MKRTCLVLIALAAAALAACESSSGSSASDNCTTACAKIAKCQLCILDQTGQCMTQSNCNSTCKNDATSQKIAACMVKISGCDQAQYEACIQAGSGSGTSNPPSSHTVNRGGKMHNPAAESTCGACHDGTKAPLCTSCHGG